MGRYLGEFEHTLLVALLRRAGDASPSEIQEEILRTTGRDASVPAVYVTLKRMADKGLVAATEPRPIAASVGRGKKRYRLTVAGKTELARSRELFDRLWRGVETPGLRGSPAAS